MIGGNRGALRPPSPGTNFPPGGRGPLDTLMPYLLAWAEHSLLLTSINTLIQTPSP